MMDIQEVKEVVGKYQEDVRLYVKENTGKVVAIGAVTGAVVVGSAAVIAGTTKIGAGLLMAAGVVVIAQGGLIVGGFCGLVWSAQEKLRG